MCRLAAAKVAALSECLMAAAADGKIGRFFRGEFPTKSTRDGVFTKFLPVAWDKVSPRTLSVIKVISESSSRAAESAARKDGSQECDYARSLSQRTGHY